MNKSPRISTWHDLIGNTPLVQLRNLLDGANINLFAKLEAFNLGGSMKDRPALCMLEEARESGKINQTTTIVESSSGNMGIGLAQVCLKYGLRFICVVDPRTNISNIRIMKAYGAIVEMVNEPSKLTGSFLEARIDRVKEILATTPNSFWLNQYSNESNPKSHQATMEEIDRALNGKIDFVFCATSTCGTIRGCSDYIKRMKLKTKVVGVDAHGSIIFGGKATNRLIPGYGSAIRSDLYRDDMADIVAHITDEECIVGCNLLLEKEALFVGGSSGAVVMAVKKLKESIPDNSNVVLILGDRGERYLDTIYNPEWVAANFKSLKSND